MTTLVVLTQADMAETLIHWALRFAEARSDALKIVCCFTSDTVQPMVPVSPQHRNHDEDLLCAAGKAIAELGNRQVALFELRHPDPVKAILAEVPKQKITLLIVGTDRKLPDNTPAARLGDRLLRFAPCDTLLIDPGDTDGSRCERVLVPMGILPGEFTLDCYALQLANSLVKETKDIFPLMVGTEIGEDSEEVARRELEYELREAKIILPEAVKPIIITADRLAEGIADASRDCQLLLTGATSPRDLPKLRNFLTASGRIPAIGLTRPGALAKSRSWPGITQRLQNWLPKLKPADRVEVFDRLQAGARVNADFLMMIGLSAGIASLGLLQNSTAVVIGAMLVAPLMTPLIGAGFALVQGNTRLYRRSLRAMGVGILIGLSIAMLMGLVAPEDDLTIEVVSRGSPTVMDLMVALLSGMAAAYAFARPNVMGVLAGVAIATALVPPLAAAGIALVRWRLSIAGGAALLHLTNLVAIILGSSLVFAALGVRGTRLSIGPTLALRRVVLGLILIALLLTAPLGYQLAKQLDVGQIRPMAFPLSNRLYDSLAARIDQEPGVEIILSGRAGTGENLVGIILSATHPVPQALTTELTKIVREIMGEDTEVQVSVLQNAFIRPSKPEEKTQ